MFMKVITTNENRNHQFEREQRKVNERVQREEKERGNCVLIV